MMKKSRKYLAATAIGIFIAIALMTLASRVFMTDSIPYVPARTPPAELAQLANFTRIRVEGDFSLELTQVQDYSIEYSPLNANRGEFTARVENDTLIVEGFGNRTEANAAVLRIGIPVLDTLDVLYAPEVTVSNFTAPLMNIRLNAFGTFTLRNNVVGNLDLVSQGSRTINLQGNTLTTQSLRIEGRSDLNISSD
jgi:hypothetical protein